MNTKRVAIAIMWTYSGWIAGSVAAFLIGTPVVLGLAAGVAAAVFFGLDPLGVVWTKTDDKTSTAARLPSVETSQSIVEAPAH
jgi:hypothetical protein